MRPELLAEVREWVERATEDLREAQHDLVAQPPLLRGAVFHCQQAVEKTLKAFLTAQEEPFRRTHDLDELGTAAVAHALSLEPLVESAIDLTPYAWRFRYPGTAAAPTVEEAERALAIARRVCEVVFALLPEEVRPSGAG
jgi:HEPN domain-containing protein